MRLHRPPNLSSLLSHCTSSALIFYVIALKPAELVIMPVESLMECPVWRHLSMGNSFESEQWIVVISSEKIEGFSEKDSLRKIL